MYYFLDIHVWDWMNFCDGDDGCEEVCIEGRRAWLEILQTISKFSSLTSALAIWQFANLPEGYKFPSFWKLGLIA